MLNTRVTVLEDGFFSNTGFTMAGWMSVCREQSSDNDHAAFQLRSVEPGSYGKPDPLILERVKNWFGNSLEAAECEGPGLRKEAGIRLRLVWMGSSRQAYKLPQLLLFDPAAGENEVAEIDGGSLTGSNGALGGIEGDARAVPGKRLDGGGCRVVLVADLHLGAQRRGWFLDGNPIHSFNFAASGSQGIVFADDHAVFFWINRQNVDGLAGREAEPLALTNRVIVHACMAAKDRAIFGDDIAFRVTDWLAHFARIGVDELHVVAVRHEAQLHAFRLFRDWKIDVPRESADFFLGELAKRKFAAGKLFLRQSPKKVRLILGIVACPKEFIAARKFVATDAGVVASGKTLCADLPGHAQQRLKLHVGIAVGTGNGRASSKILFDERTHDALLELVFEVHNVVGEIQVLRDTLGVVNVIERTAAMLRRAIPLKFREAALIPQLHRQADDGPFLLPQNSGHGRGIDATGHGDRHKAGLN